MDAYVAKYMVGKTTHVTFQKEWDVIRSVDPLAMAFKFAAMVFVETIREKHKAAGVPQPEDVGPNVLYFFHERQSGGLSPVKNELAVKLVGELVHLRGGHAELSDHAFMMAVDSVRADWLFWYMRRGNLIQFHPAHPPGSPRSYAFADCWCRVFRKRGLCACVMAVHLIFLRSKIGKADTEEEEKYWPPPRRYKQEVGFALGEPAHSQFSFNMPEMFDAEIDMFDHDSSTQGAGHGCNVPPTDSLAAALHGESELVENGLDIFGGLSEYLRKSPVTKVKRKAKQTVKLTPKKAEEAAARSVIYQRMNEASDDYVAQISLQ